MAADGGVPQLPWTIRSGASARTAFLTMLRVNGPWLLVPVVLGGLISGISDGPLAGLRASVFAVCFIGTIVLATFVGVLFYGRSTITVTHTELVVKRLRRRVLPRADLGELLLGFFTVQAGDLAATQLAFTTREGQLFATVPTLYWPGDELDRLAVLLGVEPRWQQERDDRLRPFYMRHLVLTGFVAVVVLLVVIVGGIVVADQVAASRQRAAARDAQHSWMQWRARHLTEQAVPGLVGVDGGVTVDDGDEDRGLLLRTSVSVADTGAETDPTTYAAAVEGTCGYRPSGDRPFRSRTAVDLGRTDGSDVGRSWSVECGPAERPAAALVGDLAERGWGSGVRRVLVRAGTVDEIDGRTTAQVEVSVFLTAVDEPTLRRVLERGCALPGEVTLSVTRLEGDGPTRDTGTVDCDALDDAVTAWQGG